MPATATRWEVEWCESIPLDENGDADLDAAVMRRKFCPDREAAFALAREMLPVDAFGSVAVTEQQLQWDAIDRCRRWEYVGETEHISE